MAISINWGTRIIFIPRNDLTLVQTTPVELRSMDLNWFRIQVKELESSEAGLNNPDVIKHNTEVSLGGLTYARVIEIINNYTITFEDGNYAVNLMGANSNVGDKVNVNQVSVRSANSAGMTSSPAIEYASFGSVVTIDTINGVSGTTYPIGTLQRPSNNIIDAMLIAKVRGFNTLYFVGNFTIGSNITIVDYVLVGSGQVSTTLTFVDGCITTGCIVKNLTIEGVSNGIVEVNNVIIKNWGGTTVISSSRSILFHSCLIEGTFTVPPTFQGILKLINCKSTGTIRTIDPTININNSHCTVVVKNYAGALTFKNCSHDVYYSLDFSSGRLHLDPTITAGTFSIRGTALFTNLSIGTTINTEGLMNKSNVSEATWDEPLIDHVIPGSTGSTMSINEFNGAIHIDAINGSNGTDYPVGTHTYPVKNMPDALTINNRYGFNGYCISNDFVLSHNMQDSVFDGSTSFIDDSILFNNVICTSSQFNDLKLSGAISGNNNIFKKCYIENMTSIEGEILGGRITGNLKIVPGGTLSGVDIVVEGDTTTIDLQHASGTVASFDVNSGYIMFINAVSGCLIELNIKGGEIELDSSCIGGEFYIEGYGTLYNNSNMTIKGYNLISLETIPASVLNSLTSDFNTIGTIGAAINDGGGSSSGIDETGVHNALDSYVNKDLYKANITTLATKNDLQLVDTHIQSLHNPTLSEIATTIWSHSKALQISDDVAFIKNIEGGKWEITNNQMIFYNEVGDTIIAKFNLYNKVGVLSEENVVKRVRT